MQDTIEAHWKRIEALQTQLKNNQTIDQSVLEEITLLQAETKEMMNTVFQQNQQLEFIARQATLS